MSIIGIAMGIVILISDIVWLVIGSSYTYAPWLALGIIILIADIIWLLSEFVPIGSKKQPIPATTPR